MFTRSAQVLALVSAPFAMVMLGVIAFAGSHMAVFPLMAVAVGAMGVEQMLLPWKMAHDRLRTDHVKVGGLADHVGSSPWAALTLAIRRNCVSH